MREHCLDQSNDCKTCNGNECNSMKQFQSCYFNNTGNEPSSAPLLASNDDSGSIVCEKFNDKCFTLITEKGIIIKDCLHEYAEREKISVDFLKKYTKSSYDVCSTPLCNNHDIRPMYCIACDSSKDKNCTSIPLTNATECRLEMNSSGCFHHFDGQNTQRGCIANLDEKMRTNCESDSDDCKKCVGNACNSRLSFQKCVSENLKPDDSKESKLCKRYFDGCFIHVANETVRRGCKSDIIESSDKNIDLETDCRNESICEVCSTKNNCNNREVINEQCIECKSRGIGMCANAPLRLESINCTLALKRQGCYLMQENLVEVQRGCLSHLNKLDRNNCSQGNSTCKMCFGDKCNKKATFQTCYACQSEINRDRCLNSPKLSKEITCSHYMDHCYSTVADGLVIRGCTGDETVPTVEKCNANSEICKHCSADRPCNIETIEPITCVSCDSLVDPTCATNTTFDVIESCPALNLLTQRCYHYINKTSGQHKRGKFFVERNFFPSIISFNSNSNRMYG